MVGTGLAGAMTVVEWVRGGGSGRGHLMGGRMPSLVTNAIRIIFGATDLVKSRQFGPAQPITP